VEVGVQIVQRWVLARLRQPALLLVWPSSTLAIAERCSRI
jgi:hypothetical protein